MLRAERIQSRAVAGDDVDTAELLALPTTIEEISPVAPHTVRVELARGRRVRFAMRRSTRTTRIRSRCRSLMSGRQIGAKSLSPPARVVESKSEANAK